jgi:Bacterial HORMA domain family 1
MSYSSSQSQTFTIADARKIAAHVAGDMRLLNSYYDYPALADIDDYLEELAQLLNARYLESLEIGFKREGRRVFSLFYEVLEDGTLSDNRAGGVPTGYDVEGAEKFNFVTYSAARERLSSADWEAFKKTLPVQRTSGSAPVDGEGHWVSDDRSYASGNRGVRRRQFVPNG